MTTQAVAQREPEIDLLALIEKVVSSPDISVEEMQALLDMQLQMEDRRAEKQFDAAMIAAQNDVQALRWDKVNPEKNSRNVSYPKIDKMLRPVREKHGFTMSFDTEAGPSADMVYLCCDVSHTGGHRRRYRSPMPIDGQGPKGGGVMTKPQAVNAGTSYGMRNLAKMIWNIPMLVDKEDTDGNVPYEHITEKQAADLRALGEEVKADIEKFCQYYKIDKLENLPASQYQSAIKAFEKKRKAA
jgi:hypothetical protein